MINVEDEILESEARFRIRDAQGNILFDNLTIEQITPVIQQGTEQNGNLYNNIKASIYINGLYNEIDSVEQNEEYQILKLNYNLDKYEKGMVVNIELLPKKNVEIFNSKIHPTFSALGTVDGWTLSGDSVAPFDNNLSSGISNSSYDTGRENTLLAPFLIKPKKVFIKYSRHTDNTTQSNGVAMYGIKKDGTQEEIFRHTSATANITVENNFNIETESFYKGFYFLYPRGSLASGNFSVYEVSIVEGEKISNMSLEIVPNYLNINNLGNVLINGMMEEGKKYELVYDGTVFNAREVV